MRILTWGVRSEGWAGRLTFDLLVQSQALECCTPVSGQQQMAVHLQVSGTAALSVSVRCKPSSRPPHPT